MTKKSDTLITEKAMQYKPLLGTVKDLFSSNYHGVRKDKRKDKVWWRASIMLNNNKVYLGAYLIEDEAGYAFNVAHKIFTNGKLSITNNVSLGDIQSQEIEDKVVNILLDKGYINCA